MCVYKPRPDVCVFVYERIKEMMNKKEPKTKPRIAGLMLWEGSRQL